MVRQSMRPDYTMCVHEWTYGSRFVRADDLTPVDTPYRTCRICQRTEMKWGTEYSKDYSPVFQPWEEENSELGIR